jgi:hypothetical protein
MHSPSRVPRQKSPASFQGASKDDQQHQFHCYNYLEIEFPLTENDLGLPMAIDLSPCCSIKGSAISAEFLQEEAGMIAGRFHRFQDGQRLNVDRWHLTLYP